MFTTRLALILVTSLMLVHGAVAQQKQHLSFTIHAENSKITRSLNIEVEDMPNHIVRVYENHQTFGPNAPMIDGVKAVELYARGITDAIELAGPGTQYVVFTMDNGDKFFARLSSVAQTGPRQTGTASLFGPITNGTGKLDGIQGIVWASATIDYAAGAAITQYEVDYSVRK